MSASGKSVFNWFFIIPPWDQYVSASLAWK